MNVQELATAVVYELPLVLCVLNNGFLGNVRQWQEMFFDRRYSATCLRYRKSCRRHCTSPGEHCPPYIPDFVKLAESYGAAGIRVGSVEEIESAFLARICGLFSGKSYNLNSLAVGTTEDETISRMTISLTSSDKTFEQIKKQLNRSVGTGIYPDQCLFRNG